MQLWLVLHFNQDEAGWVVVGEHFTEDAAHTDAAESKMEEGGNWAYCTYSEAYRRFRVARQEYNPASYGQIDTKRRLGLVD